MRSNRMTQWLTAFWRPSTISCAAPLSVRPRAAERVSELATHCELDRELTRRPGACAKCGNRVSERRRHVAGVREVASVGVDGPATMVRTVFDAAVEEAVRELSLDVVVERRVVHGGLRRRVGRD